MSKVTILLSLYIIQGGHMVKPDFISISTMVI